MINKLRKEMELASRLAGTLAADDFLLQEIESVVRQIALVFSRKNKLIIFGNGGSMADAMHFAEELTGRYKDNRPALPAIALSDPAFLTCAANDFGFDEVFARGVEAYCLPGDMVIGISTSGNSPNVIKAMQKAQELGAFSLVLLGRDGGKLRDSCDYQILIPEEKTSRIQEMQMMILHLIIELVEKELF
ncbi:MAG: SIS domain-containing protein [Candidatus Cloacimonadota bacterium]